jgi:N-sulfoglucosamine sulfohydrolase
MATEFKLYYLLTLNTYNWWNGKQKAPKKDKPKVQIKGSKVNLTCATDGASIAYKKSSLEKTWQVYSKPVAMAIGDPIIVLA